MNFPEKGRFSKKLDYNFSQESFQIFHLEVSKFFHRNFDTLLICMRRSEFIAFFSTPGTLKDMGFRC